MNRVQAVFVDRQRVVKKRAGLMLASDFFPTCSGLSGNLAESKRNCQNPAQLVFELKSREEKDD